MKGREISRTEYVTPKPEPQPVVTQLNTITVQTVINTSENRIMGKHTRTTKGKLYTNPRLLLPSTLNKHVGHHCRIYQATGSVKSPIWNYTDVDMLIVILLPR